MIGEIIAGKYRVDSEIGVGGMGCVYRAHTLGAPPRRVAIKVLRPEVAHIEKYELRFAEEVSITSSLLHENIVRVDDHGYLRDGRQFLVLELLVGQSLAEVMQRCDFLQWDRALRIARECALALEVVHARGVVHRDLKPENLFLQPVMGREQVKLMDFGLAKYLLESEMPGRALTEPGFAIGTPTYMAPERVTGDYDCRSDLYALCVVLYEMLAGRPPFDGSAEEVLKKHLLREPLPVTQANPVAPIPRAVEQLLQKGLAKHAGARFQSATELAEELMLALTGESDPTVAVARAPEWSWQERLRHAVRSTFAQPRVRKGMAIGAAAAVVLLVIALGAGGQSAASSDIVLMGHPAERATELPPSGGPEPDPAVAENPAEELPEAAATELEAARSSWGRRSVTVEDFAIRRFSDETPCGKGTANGVSLMLCVYDDEDAASSARERALSILDSETSLALVSGKSVLLVADDGKDPEGRTIQILVDGFLARHDR